MQPRVSKASLPFSGSPGFCCGSVPCDAGLPDEGGDGADLVVVQAEGGHLGAFAPRVRILQPDRESTPCAASCALPSGSGPTFLTSRTSSCERMSSCSILASRPLDRTFRSLASCEELLGLGVGGARVVALLLVEADFAPPFGLLLFELPDLLVDRRSSRRLRGRSLRSDGSPCSRAAGRFRGRR